MRLECVGKIGNGWGYLADGFSGVMVCMAGSEVKANLNKLRGGCHNRSDIANNT